MMVEGKLIDAKDLSDSIMDAQVPKVHGSSLPLTMEQLQENHLTQVLAYTGGNKARAAEILGISRETVYSMLRRISQRSFEASVNSADESLEEKKAHNVARR
jgi:transcriptional regulator of acetoin/glycerol metabolism